MDEAAPDAKDILLTFYAENSEQARHHEQQRQSLTNMVAAVAGIVLGLMALAPGGLQVSRNYGLLLHAFLLAVLGTFGFLASLRHYERSRLHVARVHAVRREISRLFPTADVSRLYDVANREHVRRFPRISERTARVHYVWQALHASIFALGLVLAALVLWSTGL
jgi:hypothetical protein